jgi:acetoin utilization deacetylase AcuC-like enzyme
MDVTEKGFGMMGQRLLELANQYAGGKIALLLEGGYDLTALRNSVAAVLQTIQQQPRSKESLTVGGDKIEPLVRRIHQVHEKYG